MASKDSNALRFAVIGAGPWGQNFIREIQSGDEYRLTAVCTSSSDPSSFVESDVSLHKDWKKMLERESLDGVVVATDHASGNDSAATTQVLRVAVDDKVRSFVHVWSIEWSEQHWRRNSAVQNDFEVVLVRNLGNRRHIKHVALRVAW